MFALALVLGLMSGMSSTAFAETTYNLWVGGTQVTSENCNDILSLSQNGGTGESRSKLQTVPDGLKVLLMIGKMFRLYRPFGFYTSIALVLAVVSTLFLIPVITEYRETGLVERFPTLIVCCFTYLAALLSMCAGVILQALRSKERREFEIVVKRLRETEGRERG